MGAFQHKNGDLYALSFGVPDTPTRLSLHVVAPLQAAVPGPATLALLGAGLAPLLALARRRLHT